jgi:hypothetical protein
LRFGKEHRGKVTELKAAATVVARGWEYAEPRHLMHERYDLAVRRSLEEGWLKVQVKRAFLRKARNRYMVSLTSSGGRYQSHEVDVFLFWVAELDQWYWVPFEMITGRQDIMLDTLTDYILPVEPIL